MAAMVSMSGGRIHEALVIHHANILQPYARRALDAANRAIEQLPAAEA
jgi:hypothetical protein